MRSLRPAGLPPKLRCSCAHAREALPGQARQEFLDQRQLQCLFFVLAQQFGQRQAERAGHLAQQQHRNVAAARFQFSQIAFGNGGFAGQGLACQSATQPRITHFTAQARKEILARCGIDRFRIACAH